MMPCCSVSVVWMFTGFGGVYEHNYRVFDCFFCVITVLCLVICFICFFTTLNLIIIQSLSFLLDLFFLFESAFKCTDLFFYKVFYFLLLVCVCVYDIFWLPQWNILWYMYPVIVPNDFMYSISCFSWIHFFFSSYNFTWDYWNTLLAFCCLYYYYFGFFRGRGWWGEQKYIINWNYWFCLH